MPPTKSTGHAALDRAQNAYEVRNRFLHDELLPTGAVVEAQWDRKRLHRDGGQQRPFTDRITLPHAENCVVSLRRSDWEMWGLHNLVQRARERDGNAASAERWIRLVAGEFTLQADGETIAWSH